jgi:hypothetical protein
MVAVDKERSPFSNQGKLVYLRLRLVLALP